MLNSHYYSSSYRRDIDALRGISIILVVAFHAFPEWIPGGFVGVDVFFVISGFLITSIILKQIENNTFSFWEFYQRRIRRLFPALLTVLITGMVLGWLFLFPSEYERLSKHIVRSIFFVQNFRLIAESGYFDIESHLKPFLHLWSLSIEEQYYLLWPALLFAILIKVKKHRFALLLAAISVLVIASFAANVICLSECIKPRKVFFHSLTRFWELGLGSLLAILLRNHNKKPNDLILTPFQSNLLFLAGIFSILFSAFYITPESSFPGWFALLPTLGAMAVILAHVRLPYWGGLVQVGLISYPLYLWHWLLISFLYIYMGPPPLAALITAIFVSILLSILTTRYIEKLRYAKNAKTPIYLLAVAFLVAAIAKYIEKNDGLPNRAHIAYVNSIYKQLELIPATDAACENYIQLFHKQKRIFDGCRTSFSSKRTPKNNLIALIGDSHAQSLFPGIAKIAQQHGFDTILLSNSGCPTLLGFKRIKLGLNRRATKKQISLCEEKKKQILSIIENEKRIQKVIFTTRGPFYLHGEIKGEITKGSVLESLGTTINSVHLFTEGFNKTFHLLNKTGHVKRVYYILENPELDFNPKTAIKRPFDYFDFSSYGRKISRELYDLRMKNYRKIVRKAASMFPKISVISVTPFLCDDKECYFQKNGNILYRDDDHFSVPGSHYIAEKLSPIIFSDK